ncbi:MAG: DUF1593 domain-containing protein [Bryobacteraceae bacterium]|nr:DUF1593 domain-containing protein [Bryobacteraceae bacterium]
MPARGALAGERPRVIVSTDIGGTDPDDFQSMVHLLLYADVLDLEGLISSPYGPGRKEHILEVIERYERDYPRLRAHSHRYPTPPYLRSIAKQGALEAAGWEGVGLPTEGSRWIVECARRPDPRPLWVLVWGGPEDLAQALHDAPDILPRLRVYFIGGPNKMWGVNAYAYIERQHPNLWMIEANSTYRGWFVGGNQEGEWGNEAFVGAHVAGRGHLGAFFTPLLGGRLKMGDSPSVAYLLRGTPEDPSQPGWGGKFVRAWEGRNRLFERLTTEADEVEVFGVVEFALPAPAGVGRELKARVVFDGRVPVAVFHDGRRLRFRFAPRDAKVWTYVMECDDPRLRGWRGAFTAKPPSPERIRQVSRRHPNWWTDDQDPAAAEGVHAGARHVSRWREQFLGDFAARLRRLQGAPAHARGVER